MAQPRDIQIVIEQHDPLTEKYLTSPNVLHRGEADDELGFDYRGYTLRERAMLAALLTMRSGYRCSRSRIANMAPELGGDALDTVLRGLREKGHLRVERGHKPAGTVGDDGAEGGRFVWRWTVSLRPRADWATDARRRLAARAGAGRLRDQPTEGIGVSAGQSMPGSAGHGSDSDDSDEPIPGSTMDGSTMHGSTVDGSSAPYKKEQGFEKDQGEERPAPPPPPDAGTPAAPAQIGGGTGHDQSKHDERVLARAGEVFDDILERVPQRRRPRDGARDRLVAALADELAAGWRPGDLTESLNGSFASAGSVAKVMYARIRELGPPPPPPVPARPTVVPAAPVQAVDDGLEERLLAQPMDAAAARMAARAEAARVADLARAARVAS